MKMKFYYYISKNGELWGEFCSIINGEKYNIGYSVFLSRKLTEIKYPSFSSRVINPFLI